MFFKIYEEILEKINQNRVSAEIAFQFLQNQRLSFTNQENYLLSNLKIEFNDSKFWYFLGKIYFNNYIRNKSKGIYLQNALYCFNKPFEKNKERGKTVICDSFQNPKDLFALEYEEYFDLFDEALDYLYVIYNTTVFYEGFTLPNIDPEKPELIERYEVVIRADYNDYISKNRELLIKRIKEKQLEIAVLNMLRKKQKIELKELSEKLNLNLPKLENIIEKLVIDKKLDGKIHNKLLTVKKITDKKEEIPIIFSENGQCAICRQNIEEQSLSCSNCSSKFHIDCFLKWIKTKETCPVCQKSMNY